MTTPAGRSWVQVGPEDTRNDVRMAAQEMGSLVESTLGPFGRDKMVVRNVSDLEGLRVMVTNDGVAIIEEFEGETEHPIAERFVSLAEGQEEDYGDGTTTAVLLGSELLTTGVDLLERGLHPQTVIEGFSIGGQRAIEILDRLAIPIRNEEGLDRDALRSIAMAGMVDGRPAGWPVDEVVDDVVDAVLRVSEPERAAVELSNARTQTVLGGGVADTHAMDGVLIPADPLRGEGLLPAEGGLFLTESDLEIGDHASDLSFSGSVAGELDPADLNRHEAVADAIADAGVAAVVSTAEVPTELARRLASRDVVTVRSVNDWMLDHLQCVTGADVHATIVPEAGIDPADLPRIRIDRRELGPDDEWLEIRAIGEDRGPGTTIVVRGGTERAAGEAERRIKDGKNALRAAIGRHEALPAGGAVETEAALAVRDLAPRIGGREQVAVEAFGDVLESIPLTLAQNAGLDQLDALTELRSLHDAGNERAGIDAQGRVVENVTADGGGILPYLVVSSALVRAIEFATTTLRIDSMIVHSGDGGSMPDSVKPPGME